MNEGLGFAVIGRRNDMDGIAYNGFMIDGLSGLDPLNVLTSRQRSGIRPILEEVRQAEEWSWQLPVLLHESSWLRLMRIRLSQLSCFLPPDGREDAPELARFRSLIADGVGALEAEQLCWAEFGMEDCQRALQRFWEGEEQVGHGWTMRRYLGLVSRYRRSVECGIPTLPMLVLAQEGSLEQHQLFWVTDSTPTMRHTCA